MYKTIPKFYRNSTHNLNYRPLKYKMKLPTASGGKLHYRSQPAKTGTGVS
jgi:hypothetical protein